MNWLKILINKIKSKPTKVIEYSCRTCKFKINENCTVGTYYDKQGIKQVCYGGELWESKNNKQ